MTGEGDTKDRRLAAGRKTLALLRGDSPASVLDEVAKVAPDFPAYVEEFVYGELFERQGLETRDRMVSTLSCLTCMGGVDGPLELYVDIALTAGLTPKEIVEVFLHCLSLAGFPRVQNALLIAGRVFERRRVGLEQ